MTEKEKQAKKLAEDVIRIVPRKYGVYIDAKAYMDKHYPPADERYEKFKDFYVGIYPEEVECKELFAILQQYFPLLGERDTTLIDEAIEHFKKELDALWNTQGIIRKLKEIKNKGEK